MREDVPSKRFSGVAEMRRRRVFAVVPTLLTLGNAVCGFASITIMAGLGPLGPSRHAPFYAAVFIFVAMVFDALDGPVPRLSKQAIDFGAQLDSHSDAISFCAAPAFLILKVSNLMLKVSPSSLIAARLLWIIAVLYMLCAVLRLARFNLKKDADHDSFVGLPSPAAAAMVASMVVIGPQLDELTDKDVGESVRRFGEFLTNLTYTSLPIVTLAVACLMVSRIRYVHVFNQLFRGRRSFQHLIKLIFILVTIFAVHEFAIPLICIYFVMAAPVRALWLRVVLQKVPPKQAASEASSTEESPAA